MGSKLKTVLNQVGVVGGALQEAPPPVEVEQHGSFLHGNRQKGRLFVMVEARSPNPSDIEALVRGAIGETYFRDPSLSATSCLLRAIRVAHERLQSENEGFPPKLRNLAGVTCVVLKGTDLYFAQAGPSLAYLLHSEGFEALEGQPDGPPLGGPEDPDPALSHHRLSSGGTVALCSSSVRDMRIERVKEALAGEARWALQTLYEMAIEGRSIGDLSIAVLQMAGSFSREPEPIRRVAPQPDEWPRLEPFTPSSRTRSRRYYSARFEEEPLDPSGAQVGDRMVAFLESAGGTLRHSPSEAAAKLSSIAFRACIVVLLAIVAFWGVRYYQARTTEASAADAVGQAQQLEKEANANESILIRRRLMTEAYDMVTQATEIRSSDLQARALRLRIEKQLDELNTVARLRRAAPLVDLAVLDPKADPAQLVIQGIDVFVLDSSGDRVYKYLLEPGGERVQAETNPVLLRKGDSLGNGLNVGDLEAMAWMPSGGARQRSALLVLDERGFLIEYDAARGLNALPVYGMGGWGKVRSIGGYAGNLYLLDTGQRNLLWYPPGPTGYIRMAYNYFHPDVTVDVSKATAMTVDDNLYLLYANGRIERYFAGRLQPFNGVLPDSPVREGTAVRVGAETKSIYVADRPNSRIVQLTREGQFVRQFRYTGAPDAFADLRDLAVDEANDRLYVLSRQQVYALQMPRLGE